MTDARELADRLIAAKCTSRDGTVVHASMADVLAALVPMPVERETFGYLIEKSGINNGYYFVSLAEYAHVEERFQYLYKPITLSHQPEGGGGK